MEKSFQNSIGTAIYTLPGLGFDERIFSKIDFGKKRVRHLNWIVPEPAEHIADYAKRMSANIENNGDRIVLIGHSFGGIMAQEMARIVDVQTIILVSSVKCREEIPWRLRAIAPLGLHHLFSKKLIRGTFAWWANSHGYSTAEEQRLFKSMIEKQTDGYLQWALKTVSEWQPMSATNAKIIHIHGENDKTFPVGLLKQPCRTVKGGTHFMVFNQAETVSKMIREEISE